MLPKLFSLVGPIAFLTALGPLPHGQAASVSSTFDSDIDGWTAISVSSGPTHIPAGGNPAGYLFVDNDEGLWTYVIAPAKFLGDLSAYDGGTITFDGNQLTGNGTYSDPQDYGHLFINGPSDFAVLDLALGSISLGQWVTYSTDLNAAAWGKTPGEWAALLANVTDIRLSLEGTFGSETNGFDNFILQTKSTDPASVPEPASFGLLAAGCLALASLRRRSGPHKRS